MEVEKQHDLILCVNVSLKAYSVCAFVCLMAQVTVVFA